MASCNYDATTLLRRNTTFQVKLNTGCFEDLAIKRRSLLLVDGAVATNGEVVSAITSTGNSSRLLSDASFPPAAALLHSRDYVDFTPIFGIVVHTLPCMNVLGYSTSVILYPFIATAASVTKSLVFIAHLRRLSLGTLSGYLLALVLFFVRQRGTICARIYYEFELSKI